MKVLVMLGTLFLASLACAQSGVFEYEGLHIGMTKAEAISVLEKRYGRGTVHCNNEDCFVGKSVKEFNVDVTAKEREQKAQVADAIVRDLVKGEKDNLTNGMG